MLKILIVIGGYMDDTQVPILPSDEDNAEERLEKLPEDNDRSFSPPDDVKSTVPDDNEVYDSMDDDEHQAYDEGKSNAAEVNDPGDRGVKVYRPKDYSPPQHGPVKVRKLPAEDS
jgi:hypothetical protein